MNKEEIIKKADETILKINKLLDNFTIETEHIIKIEQELREIKYLAYTAYYVQDLSVGDILLG